MAVSVLDNFMERAGGLGLGPGHISLFLSIYLVSLGSEAGRPFHITRRGLMAMSRLKSASNYHRKLGDLVALGFIRYEPSYHPLQGSRVSFLPNADPMALRE